MPGEAVRYEGAGRETGKLGDGEKQVSHLPEGDGQAEGRSAWHPEPSTWRSELSTQRSTPSVQHPTPSSQRRTSRVVGALAALGAVIIWGFTFVPTKVALAEMGPLTLAVLRFTIALAVVGIAALRLQRGNWRHPQLSWRTLSLLGFTSVTLYFGFQNIGMALTSVTEAGLMSSTVPAFTALLAAIVLKERIGRLRLLGVGASVVGVVAVALAGSGSGSGGSIGGDLLVLLAAAAWAVYTLINKGAGGKMPETLLLAYTMALGTLFLLPATGVEIALVGFGPVTPTGWLSVLFLALFASGISFYCWNTALRHLDASEAATYVNLVPVVAVATAVLLLGETLLPAQLLGGTLVILGVYLAGR